MILIHNSLRKRLKRSATDLNAKRFNILSDIRKLSYANNDEIVNYQVTKLNEILNYAEKYVPFYANSFLGLTRDDVGRIAVRELSELHNIEVLTKNKIKLAKNNIVSIEKRPGCKWNASGGSTGEPLKVLQDAAYREHAQASFLLALAWRDVDPFDSVAKLWGAERDTYKGKKPLLNKIKDFVQNRLVLNSFVLNEATMDEYLRLFSNFSPEILVGYGNALEQLALHNENKFSSLYKFNKVHTGAGVLTDHMRANIERSFCCEIFDHYGTREVASIASECSAHDGLHVMVPHNIVEVVDRSGQPVKPGETGEVLVTTLNNYSMPLIRYRIGDLAMQSDFNLCTCGVNFPKIKKIIGRTNGVFRLQNGSMVSGEYFTHLMRLFPFVRRYQIIQQNLSEIDVLIESNTSNLLEKNRNELIQKIKLVMGNDCHVKIITCDHIPNGPNGKFQNTISKIMN